jgi:hypothetical protein
MLKELLIAGAAIALPVIGHAETPAGALPARVDVAHYSVRANGCHDTSQTFSTTVPNVEQLDRDYHGATDGIEIVETEANNGHAIRNVRWTGPNTLTVELYARGAGNWVDPPKIFGQSIGGGACIGAAGASEGVIIYAHYRQAPDPSKGS